MTTLLVGCGSIGIRHLRNLIDLGEKVTAYDTDAGRLSTAIDIGASAADNTAAEACDHVVIATPASSHVSFAWAALARGQRVFVEKPLSHSLVSAEALASQFNTLPDAFLRVGYMLRFDPALIALRERIQSGGIGRVLGATIHFGQALPLWRPSRDFRQTPTAQPGGGIILEASHELDLLLWLFGSWRSCTSIIREDGGWGLPVEDTVAALIETVGGGLVELHLDMTRAGYRRDVEVRGTTGTARWSLDPAALDAMYLDEMRAFLNGEDGPGMRDGIEVLRLVEAIEDSSSVRSTIYPDWNPELQRIVG